MRLLLEQHGMIMGGVLLLIVTACALFLGRKAAHEVTQFREEHHERFRGREEK